MNLHKEFRVEKVANEKGEGEIAIVTLVCLVIVGVVLLGMWGCPHYNVWQQGLAGEAELARANQNRQIAVQEAMAKKESAKLLAEAEVERSRGVAQANEIIGKSLRENEAYLRYLWINNLKDAGHEVIYVPTEANLPILEASRLKK